MSVRIKEIIMIICFAGFIFMVNNMDKYQNVNLVNVVAQNSEEFGIGKMEKFGAMEVKKDFGINVNDYEQVIYYGHSSIMNSEKILLIKMNNEDQGDSLLEEIDATRKSDANVFKAYAPDQYQLLMDSLLEIKGNYLFFVVSDNVKEIKGILEKNITE